MKVKISNSGKIKKRNINFSDFQGQTNYYNYYIILILPKCDVCAIKSGLGIFIVWILKFSLVLCFQIRYTLYVIRYTANNTAQIYT